MGGFKGDKETGRRSGPKQREFRVGGLSKVGVGSIDRASRPWGICCEKKDYAERRSTKEQGIAILPRRALPSTPVLR